MVLLVCWVFARRGWGRIADVGSLDLFRAGLGYPLWLEGFTSCVCVKSTHHVHLSRAYIPRDMELVPPCSVRTVNCI